MFLIKSSKDKIWSYDKKQNCKIANKIKILKQFCTRLFLKNMFICLHWRLFQTGRVEFLLFKVILLLSVGGFPIMFVGLITGETLHERDGVCMLDTVVYWSPRAGLVEVGWAGDGVRYLHDLSGWYSNILLLVAVDGSNGILDEAAVCQWSHNWWITELALMDPLVYPSNGGKFIVCCNAISWIKTFKKIIKLHVHAM